MFSGCINLLARHKITTLERLEALINSYRGGKAGMPDKEFRHMMHACFGEYVLFRNKLKAEKAVPGSVAARAAALNANKSKAVGPQIGSQDRNEKFGYIGKFRNVSTPRATGSGRRTRKNRRK